MAKTTVTKFCSHTCASRAYKERKRREKIELAEEEPERVALEEIQSKEYLSIQEVIRLFGVSRSILYRMINSGKLPSANFGGRVILRRSDCEMMFQAFIRKPKPQPQKEPEYYSVKEVEEMHGIGYSRLNVILNHNKIPKKLEGGKLYCKYPILRTGYKLDNQRYWHLLVKNG